MVDDPLARLGFFGVAFLEGNTDEMDRQMAWAAGKPQAEEIFLAAKSDTEAYYGRLHSAREFSRRAADSALRSDEKEAAAQWMLSAAVRDAEFGNFDRARRAAIAALELSTNHDAEILAALTFARVEIRRTQRNWLIS